MPRAIKAISNVSRITCVERGVDPLGRTRVTHVGGQNRLWRVEDVIQSIRDRLNLFYAGWGSQRAGRTRR